MGPRVVSGSVEITDERKGQGLQAKELASLEDEVGEDGVRRVAKGMHNQSLKIGEV